MPCAVVPVQGGLPPSLKAFQWPSLCPLRLPESAHLHSDHPGFATHSSFLTLLNMSFSVRNSCCVHSFSSTLSQYDYDHSSTSSKKEMTMNQTIINESGVYDDRWIVAVLVVVAWVLQMDMSRKTRATGTCDKINATWLAWMVGVLAVLYARIEPGARSYAVSLPSGVMLSATRLARAHGFKTASPADAAEWLDLGGGKRGHVKTFGCAIAGFLLSRISAECRCPFIGVACVWLPELSRFAVVAQAAHRATSDIVYFETARAVAVSQVVCGHLAFQVGVGLSDVMHAYATTGAVEPSRVYGRLAALVPDFVL